MWLRKNINELLRVDAEAWKLEIPKMEKFFRANSANRLPKRIKQSIQ